MRFLTALSVACVLASPAYPQAADTAPAVAAATEAKPGALQVARNGNEVLVAWELPSGNIRQIELMRNSSSNAVGRDRVAVVRAETTLFIDEVSDLGVTYWYWLKLTFGDGRVVNLGPVATPAPSVWTP